MAKNDVFDADAHYEQYTRAVRRNLSGTDSAGDFVDELIAKGLSRRAMNMTTDQLSARSKKGWETRQ